MVSTYFVPQKRFTNVVDSVKKLSKKYFKDPNLIKVTKTGKKEEVKYEYETQEKPWFKGLSFLMKSR